MEDKYKIIYAPVKLPEIVESSFPSIEVAWEELSQGHDPDSNGSHKHPTKEDIISTNWEISSAIKSSKRNVRMYKSED